MRRNAKPSFGAALREPASLLHPPIGHFGGSPNMIELGGRLQSTIGTGLRDLSRGVDSWRRVNSLLRVLCSIHFFGSAFAMARLWDRRNLDFDYGRCIRGIAAQLDPVCHSRTGQLHLGGHRDPRGGVCRVARRK